MQEAANHERRESLNHTMDAFGFFGDHPPRLSSSVPDVNFAELGPFASTPMAHATCPSGDLSSTIPLGLDSAANSNPSAVQIPDEDPLSLGDDSFWEGLPILPWLGLDPFDGHHLLPEPHARDVENEGSLLNVFNFETNVVVPPFVSRSSTNCCRWQNFVWLIRACHRFSRAAAASLRAKVPEAPNIACVIKGVMKKRGKFVCETRVTKKIQQEKKKKPIRKVWLGTYQTEAQAARALDVGKYFFNAKGTKTFYDPNSETMLSTLSTQLLAQPLEVLVREVKHIAEYYGTHGTLP